MLIARALTVAVSLLACSSKDAPSQGSGSATQYDALGKKPANARRSSPPPGIETSALAVGAAAPALTLTTASGQPWTLADQNERVLVVFYRGDW